MEHETTGQGSPTLVSSLRETLAALAKHPYPEVSNPPGCKKRASVALVLRIRPDYKNWPQAAKGEVDLEGFFAQDWVRHGDPEVAFIKRAARVGDRWTSHVALPGGKRDPEDEDDKAVAVRETVEEIGLDLNSPDALFVGNLPERVVRTSWGTVPLMVLCPFIFLWTKPDIPPLKLQPNEVASTHWVPLRVLLSPSSRTYEYVDPTDRFARRGGPIVKAIASSILGKMRFSAIGLVPSESLYCSSTEEFFPSEATITSKLPFTTRIYAWWKGEPAVASHRASPLLLWGLTLGIMADFLDQLPPHNAVQLWTYPTLTSPDARWIISLLTISLKTRNKERLQGAGMANQTAVDMETEAVSTGGMSDGWKKPKKGSNGTSEYAVGVMLEGYYNMMTTGVAITAGVRVLATVALVAALLRRYRRR